MNKDFIKTYIKVLLAIILTIVFIWKFPDLFIIGLVSVLITTAILLYAYMITDHITRRKKK